MGICFDLRIVTFLDISRRNLHQSFRPLDDGYVPDRLSDLDRSDTARPLEQIGITMMIGDLSEFPDPRISFVNRHFNLVENKIGPDSRVGPLPEYIAIIGIKRQQGDHRLS